ncbi:hypothetical protein DPEC_G00354090 [Dallia pectoralis]|uniref:Uncharacterized protein n=1 Tax=Dallia pectoralis TaxID=75939 RepID=A0ACC2F2P3_DALPE|nr:hypothetical protein DPEC_G00354090 [Dallia pectoralis]
MHPTDEPMAVRVWSKIRCKRWGVMAFLFFLLFLLSVVVINSLHFTPSETRRLPSTFLSSTGGGDRARARSRQRATLPLHQHHLPPPPNNHNRGWKQNGKVKESWKHHLVDHPRLDHRANIMTDVRTYNNNKKNVKATGTSSKRNQKKVRQPSSSRGHHKNSQSLPVTALPVGQDGSQVHNGSRSELINFPQSPTTQQNTHPAGPQNLYSAGPQTVKRRQRHTANQSLSDLSEHICTSDGQRQRQTQTRHSGKKDQTDQQSVEKVSREHRKNDRPSAEASERKHPHLSGRTETRPAAGTEEGNVSEAHGCKMSAQEGRFTDTDTQKIRTGSPDSLPWLSKDDILKMEFLRSSEVISKARVPAHGQVLKVGLSDPNHSPSPGDPVADYSGHCQHGLCALIKRPDDWIEVFAFHLDRVLGLNRSLPTILRAFNSHILPYRYTRGPARPLVWWDPNIQHLDDDDNDQNSFHLTWPQYQSLLKAKCGSVSALNEAPCVGVHHEEWGRLALFDFLLQVNDRLDRYCCGFQPDPTEPCVENLLHTRCRNPKDLVLVHILVRRAEPSRLVFIDNAGRPNHSHDNINFRLLEGIDEFPERAVSVLQSGCLESLLLSSLYTDKEFWESRGGAPGLKPLIRTVEQRGRILLQHVHDKSFNLNRYL